MTGHKYLRTPRTLRAADHAEEGKPGPQWRDAEPRVPLYKQPLSQHSARHDFANLVVRRLVDSKIRIAVINEHGRPALVDCRERLFELLQLDHALIGVYAEGARVRDVMDDLKADGL